MDETFFIKRGDTSPFLRFALEPAATVVLTGAAVLFQMRRRNGAMLVSRAATVITAVGTPTVQFNWQAGDTVEAGNFEGEFRVTYGDGSIETFPNEGFIPIRISEDVA